MVAAFSDELTDTLFRAEAAAYERGKEDGRSEMLNELMVNVRAKQQAERQDTEPQPPRSGAIDADGARPASARKRAPKGTVRSLINRVLSSRPGLKPKQILAHAETANEKMVQPPSLRNQLRRGLKQGQYRSTHGRWHLADPKKNEAEGNPSEDKPSASNTSHGGSYAPTLAEPPDRL